MARAPLARMALLPIAAALVGAGSEPKPIRLVVNTSPEGVEVQVIGAATSPVTARYRLTVSGAGNRSVQAGTARLAGGRTQRLLQLRLGANALRDWSVHLEVSPESQSPYEERADAA